MSTREFKYVLTNRPATGNQSVYSAFAKREKQGILGLVEGVEAIVLVLDENCALGALRANKRTGRFLTRMQTDTTEELDDRLRQFLDFVVQKWPEPKDQIAIVHASYETAFHDACTYIGRDAEKATDQLF